MTNISLTISRRTARVIAAVPTLAIGVAACSSDSATESPAAAEQPPAATAAPVVTAAPVAPDAAVAAKSTDSELGEVLTDTDGLTLYGFTNDVDAISTCYGTCADAWPPVIVPPDFSVGPGLDVGIFATAARDDGTTQLVAGKFPLYTFAGDAVPGDIEGHGSGDVWFAVSVDGTLFDEVPAEEAADDPEAEADAGAPVTVATTELGDALVDVDGLTLYGFTNDTDGTPTCDGDCADAWPPAFVESDELPAGLDAELFSVVERSDGTFQLAAGVWPLYRFAADVAPGDVKGHGSGDVWFVVAPDGTLIPNA